MELLDGPCLGRSGRAKASLFGSRADCTPGTRGAGSMRPRRDNVHRSMTLGEPQVRSGRVLTVLRRFEGTVLVVAFLLSMILPLIDALGRPLHGFYLPGSATYRSQLTLWLAFLGGLLATREGRHLTLSTAEAIGHTRVRSATRLFSSSVAAAVCAVLAYSAAGVVVADRQQGTMLAIGV